MGDGLRIRRATLADYEAVLALHTDIYDGLDYMPVLYHYFLQSPKHLILVGEENGRIVALTNLRFQSEENLVAGFSARSSPSLTASAGLRTAGESAWKTAVLKDYPTVEYFIAVSRTFPELFDGRHKIYYQMHGLLYKATVAELRSRLTEYHPFNSEPLLDISYSDVERILSKTNKIPNFLKSYCKEYVIGQWHYRPMKMEDQMEMKELFATSCKTFVTVDNKARQNFETTSASYTGSLLLKPDTNITSMSYSVLYPVKFGLRYDIIFYGQSPECLASHVWAHVRHVTRIYSGSVATVIIIPDMKELKPEDVASLLRPLLGDQSNYGSDPDRAPAALWSSKVILPSKL